MVPAVANQTALAARTGLAGELHCPECCLNLVETPSGLFWHQHSKLAIVRKDSGVLERLERLSDERLITK